MNFLDISRIVALAGLGLGILGILLRLGEIMRRPFKQDLSRERGQVRRGILYAFTLGMAPWEKESTRLHWVAYIRGILFHVGIFTAILLCLAGLLPQVRFEGLPLWVWLPAVALTGLGALAGFAGIPMRQMDPKTRLISLPDDYFSVFFTSLFIALACLALIVPGTLPIFLITGGLLAVYVPWSKIRHCAYFFYSKFFFGMSFGRRGVIGQPKGKYAE